MKMLTGAKEAEIRTKNHGYLHAEAYCLMTYQCKTCLVKEILWNSRDGVTPFIISCRQCGEVAKHINFHLDARRRDFEPKPGMRIFTDLSHARAYDFALGAYERMLESEYRRDDVTKEKFIRLILKDMQLGDPGVVVVGED
jgi:hypothetical protein